MIVSFRAALRAKDLNFGSEPAKVYLVAQEWAGQRSEKSARPGQEVAPATFNVRLAAISSFYIWMKRQGFFAGENPIDRIERPQVQAYAAADAYEAEEVSRILKSIDRSTLPGLRDAALLEVGFTIGRRVSEIAGMQWKHLTIKGKRVKIHFPRLKGGKVGDNELGGSASKALLTYLHARFDQDLLNIPGDTPIWISYSHNDSMGAALSVRAMENVVKKYCGTGKFHITRHTFGYNLHLAGATVNEVSEAMDHDNVATTSRYLKRAGASKNKHIRKLELMYGLEEDEGE